MSATPHQRSLPLPPQRLAQASDAPAISELMRASVLDLFPHFYDERQTASPAVHIAHLDMQLIEDGTYYVHEGDREIVACGGWSRRNKLYTGSGSLGDDARLLEPAAGTCDRIRRAAISLASAEQPTASARRRRVRRQPRAVSLLGGCNTTTADRGVTALGAKRKRRDPWSLTPPMDDKE